MNNLYKYQFTIFIFAQICSHILFNPTIIDAQNYIIKNYSVKDGLVQSFIIDAFNDPKGYVWLVSAEGLSRFDGIEFTNFKEHSEFFNVWPERACIDSTGIIYIRNRANQIWRWHENNISRVNLPDEYDDLQVASMKINGKSDLLVATIAHGLFLFSEDRWKHFSTDDGLYSDSLNHVSEYFNGVNYIATMEGICQYKNGIITKLFPVKNKTINTILPDSKGNLWMAVVREGLWFFDGNNIIKAFNSNNFLPNNGNVDHQDNIWFATATGLYRFAFNPDKTISGINLLPQQITSINIDKNHNIWAGSSYQGVNKISENQFKTYTEKDGLPTNFVFPIREDKKGTIWAGTNEGLIRLVNDRWTKSSFLSNTQNKIVRRISKDEENNLIISIGNKIVKYDGIRFEFIDPEYSFSFPTGYCKDNNGIEWYASAVSGLWNNKSGRWIQVELPGPTNDIQIVSYYFDSEGVIWCGTRLNGLYRINDDNIIRLNISNGLLSNAILDIDEDSDGNIWISTLGGVNVIDGENIVKSLTIEDGLATNTCYAIMCDGKNVFIGTSDGLHIYNGNDLLLFTEEDGLPQIDVNSTSITKDSYGNVWFATESGITVFDPNKFLMPEYEITPVIKKISSGNNYKELLTEFDSTPSKMFIQFDENENNITIEYSSIYFIRPQDVQFQYRLKGYSENWSDVKYTRSVTFESLPPGNYEFLLRAKLPGQEWGNQTASFPFAISALFYQTALFRISVGAICTVLIILFIKQWKNKANKKKASKYSTSSLNEDNYKKILEELKLVIEIEKQYIDPDLTLKKLAEKLNVYKEHLSEVISKEFNMNFRDYINLQRVNEAKTRLLNPDEDKYKILKIGLEVGFNSKSTFNVAFKKFTGVTPSEFRYMNSQ